MNLAVALLDEHPSARPRGMTTWGSWGVHPWSEPTTLATDEVVLAPGTQRILVLTSETGRPHAEIVAATVAAARPEVAVRVAVLPVSTAVLVRAVELVPEGVVGANAVLADVTARVAAMTWGAWLPTVAKLESPAPSLRQHVQSWLRNSAGYLAVHGDPGWVARLPISQLEPERRLSRIPPRGLVATAYECHSFGELPEPAIAALFAMGLTNRPVRREPLGRTDRVWGTSKAVEVVVSWPGPAELEPPDGRCPICEDLVWGEACAFCRAKAVADPSIIPYSSTPGVAS